MNHPPALPRSEVWHPASHLFPKTLAAVCTFLMVCGPSVRLFAASPAQPASADPIPANRGGLSDPSRLLFNDDDDDHDENPRAPGSAAAARPEGRYFFGLLDHRSHYGKDFFPDHFLGPEFDRETQVEVDYLHGEKGGQREDEGDAEFQWNPVGQLTLAGELGYDSEHQSKISGGGTVAKEDGTGNRRGFENVDLAVYHPVFQAVSKDRTLDYTAAFRLDVGIPTRTAVSGPDAQLTPYLGQLLRVGEHVSAETWTGAEFTIAPHQTDQFVYGASFGYQLTHAQVPLPGTESVTPLFELDGRTAFSHPGQDALFGVVGFNWQFTGKGNWQPRLGLGYQFPMDQGARDQLHWGIITQVFLQF